MQMKLLCEHYPLSRSVSSFMVYALQVTAFLQSSLFLKYDRATFKEVAQTIKSEVSNVNNQNMISMDTTTSP